MGGRSDLGAPTETWIAVGFFTTSRMTPQENKGKSMSENNDRVNRPTQAKYGLEWATRPEELQDIFLLSNFGIKCFGPLT
jgi:hypothetical protein